jgi:hypothetical protein
MASKGGSSWTTPCQWLYEEPGTKPTARCGPASGRPSGHCMTCNFVFRMMSGFQGCCRDLGPSKRAQTHSFLLGPRMNLATASGDEKGPSDIVLIASTIPAASTSLHETLKAGQAVRSCAAVHFKGPAPVFGDIRSVPAAVPPLPNARGVRGGRPSYAAKQRGADFMFDYGLAFSLRPARAFARGGFGSTCIGCTCGGKGAVYARGASPSSGRGNETRVGHSFAEAEGGTICACGA